MHSVSVSTRTLKILLIMKKLVHNLHVEHTTQMSLMHCFTSTHMQTVYSQLKCIKQVIIAQPEHCMNEQRTSRIK